MVARAPVSPRPANLHDGFGWCALHREAWHRAVKRGCPKCGASLPSMPAGRKVAKSSWSRATATTCDLGHNHPSKVEARVCKRVHDETPAPRRVYRNVRLPLFALPPTDAGIPHYLNVDFVVVEGTKIVRLVDAKTGRVSRDWRRGAAACEATYGLKVEEMSC